MSYRSVIITDLDETLYSWVDYFAPSFRAMVHVLSRETKAGEDDILQDFKRVYGRRGSLEYAFSVQELDLCQSMDKAEVERLVRLAKGAFARVREANLKCYAGVKETLLWAAQEGIPVIGITNAPIFQAEQRLRQLYVDHLFLGLAGWQGHLAPETHESTRAIRERERTGRYRSRVRQLWSLKSDERKPSSVGYERIINEMMIDVRNAYVVGDDLKKDIEPAIKIGANGVWASYGKSYKEKNWETLLKITHWSDRQVEETYDEHIDIFPNYTIKSFDELKLIVPSPQLRLDGF